MGFYKINNLKVQFYKIKLKRVPNSYQSDNSLRIFDGVFKPYCVQSLLNNEQYLI